MATRNAPAKGTTANPATNAAPTQAQTPAAPTATNPQLQQAFTLTGAKPYAVRPNTAQNNAASWQAIQACIAANGGQATRAQLMAAMAPLNHTPMVGYVIRRMWVVPVAPPATPTAQ